MPRITKKLVDGLKTRAKDYFEFDGDLPCFGVRVWPSGRKVYICQYRANGRTRRMRLGVHGVLTPAQARQEAAKVLSAVAKGDDPAEIRDKAKAAPTVKAVVERYLEQYAEPMKKTSSVGRDRRLLERFVIPAWGSRQVASITRSDVAELHHRVGKDTPVQSNRLLAVVSKLMNLCEQWGLRPQNSNPTKHVQRYRERGRERFLSPDELARLGSTLAEVEADGSEHPSVVTAVRLLIFTGLRRGEVLSARWSDVDLEAGTLTLRDSKTGPRQVPLSAPALAVLTNASREAGSSYICPGVRTGRPFSGIARPWARICQRAGLEGLRLHDLRHSFASVGASAGMGLPLVGALLGHRTPATTQKYSHLHQDPLRAAADAIAGQIAEHMAKQPAPARVVNLDDRRGNGSDK